MSARLKISEAEINPEGELLITQVSVIDTLSGETLRVAKITPELVSFLKMVEIDVSDFFKIQDMKRKNPNFTKLIETYQLHT